MPKQLKEKITDQGLFPHSEAILKEVKERYPEYNPAPCMYACSPRISDQCDMGRDCSEYQKWANAKRMKLRDWSPADRIEQIKKRRLAKEAEAVEAE